MDEGNRMTERSSDIERAAAFLSKSELVAIPTETVYGMAANAFDEVAVKEIFRVKNRPFYDPLILHTNSIEKIERWGVAIPPRLRRLAETFWPGPLTLLLPRSEKISDSVTAGLDRVAFRIPSHPLTHQLLEQLDFPVAAPSANPFGYVSPTSADHVLKHFDEKIAMVLDGGACDVGIESTIVGEEDGRIVVYRLGGLSVEQIERVIGNIEIRTSSSKPMAPGMLVRHYSPQKELIVVDTQEEVDEHNVQQSAYILFLLEAPEFNLPNVIHLTPGGNHEKAARQFYQALRTWDDDPDIKRIIVERLPDFGLGRAINDRLKRAAGAESEEK